jgi:Arm DNA-binding domain
MKVIFYTRNTKINGAGLVPIYLRVTANGQRFNAATGRTVKKGKWSKKGERHSGNLPEDQELNDFLATLRNKAFSIQKKLINLDRPVTIKEFECEWHWHLPGLNHGYFRSNSTTRNLFVNYMGEKDPCNRKCSVPLPSCPKMKRLPRRKR